MTAIVLPLTPPLDRSEIIAELDRITGPETTGLVIIASSPEDIKMRTWGDTEVVHQDIETVMDELAAD